MNTDSLTGRYREIETGTGRERDFDGLCRGSGGGEGRG